MATARNTVLPPPTTVHAPRKGLYVEEEPQEGDQRALGRSKAGVGAGVQHM